MLFRKPSEPPKDPDEKMRGRCATCGSVVECKRVDAVQPSKEQVVGQEPGAWNDLLYAECPLCKAASKHGVGTRVYLMPVPRGE